MHTAFEITRAEVARFAELSHDRNPVHVSMDYARRTSFGEPVVFGALVLFCTLRELSLLGERLPQTLSADFLGPVYPETTLRAQCEPSSPGNFRIKVWAGPRPVMRAKLLLTDASDLRLPPTSPKAENGFRHEARRLAIEELQEGAVFPVVYPSTELHVGAMLAGTSCEAHAAPIALLRALMTASYVVGMEIPGRQGLFASLRLGFDRKADGTGHISGFDTVVDSVDLRFQQVQMTCQFPVLDSVVASAKVTAFFRPEMLAEDHTTDDELLPPLPRLDGKTAVVTGGTRGLGAALVEALFSAGARVVATHLSDTEDSARLRSKCSSSLRLIRGDNADREFTRRLVDEIHAFAGPADLLFANAVSPMRAMAIDQKEIADLTDYVLKSLNLLLTPLTALLPDLTERSGTVVFISSNMVTKPEASWPQYVAAKLACEGALRVAVEQNPALAGIVARPPRIRTLFSDAPMSRMDSLSPVRVARTILHHVPLAHGGDRFVTLEDAVF